MGHGSVAHHILVPGSVPHHFSLKVTPTLRKLLQVKIYSKGLDDPMMEYKALSHEGFHLQKRRCALATWNI